MSRAAAAPWIEGTRFDLGLFFGGALVSFAALGLVLAFPGSIVGVFWVWLLCLDGPHMAAAYTRTYLDRDEWRRRPRLLTLPLLSFAIGPAALLVGLAIGSDAPFTAFLGIAALWGYHHVVRQHYGFLAIYASKAGDRGTPGFRVDAWCLYLGCWLPYAYFLLTHPRTRALAGPDVSQTPGPGVQAVAIACAAGFGVVLAVIAYRARSPGELRSPRRAYLALVVLIHGLVHFLVARLEPVYPLSAGPDQDFMLMAVMITAFHNVQYVALVWAHNRRRYHEVDGGPATWISATAARYLVVCLVYSTVYFAVASATAVFPRFQSLVGAHLGPFPISRVALAVWWGIAIHHYWLDQTIWRIRKDDRLRGDLGLARA